MQALIGGDLAAFMAAEAETPPPRRLAPLRPPRRPYRQRRHRPRRRHPRPSPRRIAPHGDGITVLGPAPAPLAILRGRHRRRLLLKTRRDIAVQPILRAWLDQVPVPGNARVDVDVDPVSFL